MRKHRQPMTEKVEQYLTYRRNLGYKLLAEGAYLRKFGVYADSIKHRGPLTTELALRWARLPVAADALLWARRLEIVRCFARYLVIFEPKTEIPLRGLLGPAHRRNTPHVYTEAELSALVSAAGRLQSADQLKPRNFSTLIGLVASTGLRISEALRFTRSDFDARQGVITIRETKFRKSRLVPLHPSVTKKLAAYARERDRLVPLPQADQFFVTDRGKAMDCKRVREVFRELCDGVGIVGRGHRRRPVIHDLRHTFACRCVERWYDSGKDVTHHIAALSTYLGHATIHDTYWYLTATPDLLARAAARFEPFAAFDHREGQP